MRWALGRRLDRELWAVPKHRPTQSLARVGRAGETRFTLCCSQERACPPASCPGHFPSYKGSVCCSSHLLLPPTFPSAPPLSNTIARPPQCIQVKGHFQKCLQTNAAVHLLLQTQEYLPWAKDPVVPLIFKYSLALPTPCRSPGTGTSEPPAF